MSTDIHNNKEKNNSRFVQLLLAKIGQYEEALPLSTRLPTLKIVAIYCFVIGTDVALVVIMASNSYLIGDQRRVTQVSSTRQLLIKC